MSNQPKINTEGGDYRETHNRGQYAEGDIQNKQIDSQVEQGIIANDRAQVNVQNLVQNFVFNLSVQRRSIMVVFLGLPGFG